MGETQGAIGKRKGGFNLGVDTTEVEVRSEDANLALQTTAKTLEILSGDANDDGKSSGTLTLVSATSLVAATGTVTCASVLAADTVTVNGLVYTAVAGAKADNTEFSIDTGDNECAADLADSITNDTRSGTLGDVTAVSATNVVTCTSDESGADGNAVTLVSSNGTRLAVSGSGTFTGGTDADVATVNGLTYTGVAGVKANNAQFSVDTSDTAAAADLADSINNDTRTPITEPLVTVTATPSAGVVTIDSDVGGTEGDTVDISGTANITASGATLTDVGTGARSVVVEGLDGDYNEISETIFLNGTTPVALTNQFLRVNDAYVDQVGSGGVNAGLITVRVVTGSVVQITIPIGQGQAQATNYTVGLNKEISIKDLDITVSQVAANAVSVAVKLWKRLFDDSWRLIDTYTLGNVSKHIDFENDELELPAKTDIKITADKLVGTGDATVEAAYSFREYAK